MKLIEADESSLTDLLQYNLQGDTDRDFFKAIAAAWNVAFDAIETDSTTAMELLSLIYLLKPQNIPKTLLKTLLPDERKLTASSLVLSKLTRLYRTTHSVRLAACISLFNSP